jgi:hypothetical protein
VRHLFLAVLLIVGCLIFLAGAAVLVSVFPARLSLIVLALILVAGSLSYRSARADEQRQHRRANGLCPECGYDLRATPGRCPECGWAAALPQ